MKTTRDILFDDFVCRIETAFPELPLPKVRNLADQMATEAQNEARRGARVFSDLYAELSTKSEKHKALFREHIELISKHSSILMGVLLDNNFVAKGSDKSGKIILRGKTIYAKELIIFLEKLDESVQKFYVDVYEIKDEEDAKKSGFNQTALF